jgi:PBP1b-binding outer membrane lipoprotein LpoB
MKKILLSTAVVGTLLFTGCSQKTETIDKQVYVDPELQGAPKWVMMPVVEGAVSEVGSAKRNAGNDIGFQRNEAMADARDNLARQLEIKVSNLFKSFKADTGSGADAAFDRSVESVSKQIASQTLKGTVQKDAWISKSGTMYVLVAIDTQNVEKMMEESIKTSFKNEKALYQRFLAAQAQEELEAELEKLNR